MTKLTTASYVKIALIIVVGALLLGAIGVSRCSELPVGIWGKTSMGSASVDAASVKNLSIQWGGGDVKVDVSDTSDTIELIETSTGGVTRAQQMRWAVDADTLTVDYGRWLSCFMLGQKNLEVHIPKQLAQKLGTVHIVGSSGTYELNNFGCNSLDLHLSSGDMTGQNLKAEEMNADISSGQLNVEGRFSGRVNTRTASGQSYIVCSQTCPTSIDAQVASGAVGLVLPANSGFTAHINKASGQFSSSFPLSHNGNVYTTGDGSASIHMNIASGDISINSGN